MHMNIVCVIVLGPISLTRFHAPFAIWIAYCFVDECWMNRYSVLCSICNAFCNCKLVNVSYSNKVILILNLNLKKHTRVVCGGNLNLPATSNKSGSWKWYLTLDFNMVYHCVYHFPYHVQGCAVWISRALPTGSAAVQMPVKYRNDWKSLNTKPTIWRLREILL